MLIIVQTTNSLCASLKISIFNKLILATQTDLIETTHSRTTEQDEEEILSTIVTPIASIKETKNPNWCYWVGALLLLLTIALTVGLTLLILKCKSRRRHRQSHDEKGTSFFILNPIIYEL